MAKRSTKKAIGPAAFEQYYQDLYQNRWLNLRETLVTERAKCSFADGLTVPYFMDAASVVAALTLGVSPGDDVVDLCAAPGGKTLVLATQLQGDGTLTANELSSARRARLHRVIDGHLPEEFRLPIQIKGFDASRWGVHRPSSADRILADVPCSSEEHVLRTPSALDQWTPTRSRRLAQGAYAIGCAGIDTLRPGGEMVYSTCSLSPLENDDVIERLIKRSEGQIQALVVSDRLALIDHPDLPAGATRLGETTRFGWSYLPDTSEGMGPIYIALLRKCL